MSRFSTRPKFTTQAYRPAQQSLHQQKYARLQMCILTGEPCLDACIDDGACHDIDVLYSSACDLDRVNPMFEAECEPECGADETDAEASEAEPEEPEAAPIRPFTPEPEPRSPAAPPPTPVMRSRSVYDVMVAVRKKAVRDAVLASLPEPAHSV